MSDQERQRRLHVQNRLEELNTKYGAIEDQLPPWLDSLEGFAAAQAQARAEQAASQPALAEPAPEPPPPQPAPRGAQRVWERP